LEMFLKLEKVFKRIRFYTKVYFKTWYYMLGYAIKTL